MGLVDIKDNGIKNCYNRPRWEEYFMEMAFTVSTRSTCRRRSVGAVLVKNRRILTTGYNGAPTGLQHCESTGCLREEMDIISGEQHELCRGIHAEQNAIIQAAIYGISIKGTSLFCTIYPCSICSKMLVNASIVKIYYAGKYTDNLSEAILRESKTQLIYLEMQTNKT